MYFKNGLLPENYHYLKVREEAQWVNNNVRGLCAAFQKIQISPQLQRNDFRIARIINVVTNRLSLEYQVPFRDLIMYHKMCQEMREKNYNMAKQCLEMSRAGVNIKQIERKCCEYDLTKYYKLFEDLKMQLEIRLERVRKHLL